MSIFVFVMIGGFGDICVFEIFGGSKCYIIYWVEFNVLQVIVGQFDLYGCFGDKVLQDYIVVIGNFVLILNWVDVVMVEQVEVILCCVGVGVGVIIDIEVIVNVVNDEVVCCLKS